MNIDHFLKIGDNHKMCEDYIISGVDPLPHVILSDGCSSSDNTEMGARLLCYLAKQYLSHRQGIDYDMLGNWVIYNAEMLAKNLGLSNSCLDATLIVAVEIEKVIIVIMYGDGFVITKRKYSNDTIGYTHIRKVKYKENAPFYLSYELDAEKTTKYFELFSPNKEELFNGSLSNVSLVDVPFVRSFNTDLYSTIFIASDGLESFLSDSGIKYDERQVVERFTSFKNLKGEFVKRRLKKAINEMEKEGYKHYDDISFGGFYFGEE